MSFDQRFQLGEAIPAEIGQQDCMLSGKQLATGRSVTIHLLAGGYSDTNTEVLHAIATLPPDYRVCFLGTGEYQGIPYVVTDVVAGNPPLRQWIATVQQKIEQAKELKKAGQWKIPDWARQGGAPPTAVVATPPPAPAPKVDLSPEVDEFSLMLGETAPPAPPAQPHPGEITEVYLTSEHAPQAPASSTADEFDVMLGGAAAPPAPAAPASTPPPTPQAEPGDFTRLLRTQAPASAPAAPRPSATGEVDFNQILHSDALPTVGIPIQPPAANEPGEFTRLLRTQAPTPAPEAAPASTPPTPPSAEAGEFTRLLRTQPPPSAPEAPRPAATGAVDFNPILPSDAMPKVGIPQPAANEPGEFTRLLRTQASPQAAPPPSPPPPAASEGEFTRLLRAQSQPPAPASAPSREPASTEGEFTRMMRTAPPAPSPGPIQTGPGEFTRMMSTGGNRADPPGQPAAEEDEFAKLLRNPLAPRPGQPGPMPPSMPAAQQSATPGEFTRMLQTPTPLQPRPGSAPPAPASDPVLGPNGPGEFTRMMESPMSARGLAGQPLAAPPPRQPSGEATRAFQVNVPPPAPQAPPAEEGPSAYTRIFKAPAAPPPEPAPPKPQSRRRPPLRRKEKRIGRWWIIGGVIALIVVGVFLYFMIK